MPNDATSRPTHGVSFLPLRRGKWIWSVGGQKSQPNVFHLLSVPRATEKYYPVVSRVSGKLGSWKGDQTVKWLRSRPSMLSLLMRRRLDTASISRSKPPCWSGRCSFAACFAPECGSETFSNILHHTIIQPQPPRLSSARHHGLLLWDLHKRLPILFTPFKRVSVVLRGQKIL